MADNRDAPGGLADSTELPPLVWLDPNAGEPTARITVAPGAPTADDGASYAPDPFAASTSPFEDAAARLRSRYGRAPTGDIETTPDPFFPDFARGAPRAVVQAGLNALDLLSHTGVTPAQYGLPPEELPFTAHQAAIDQLQQGVEQMPQSQGRPAQYSNAVLETLVNPINWVGPPGWLAAAKAGAYNIASGIGGEFARKQFEGTPYEKWAKLAGAWSPVAVERASQLYKLMPQGVGAFGGRQVQPTFLRETELGNQAPPAAPQRPMVAPRLATPEEINRVARRTSKEGITQPALRQTYQDLGLTGQPPSSLVVPSLSREQPAAARQAALDLKLADRAALDTLSAADRNRFKAGKEVPGFVLPSTEQAAPALAQFEPVKKEVMRAQKAFDVAQQAGRAPSALFDLSPRTLNQVPNVPQFALPRVAPEQTARLASVARGGLGRVERAAGNAPPENWGWYNLMQARDLMHALHGPAKGEQVFQTWLDSLAGTSMVNPIDNNLRSSTWYLQQALAGHALPEVHSVPDPVTGKEVRYMVGNPPPGYGAKSQQQHAERVLEYLTNTYDPVANPKPISYRMNLGGNWMPRTVDTHDIRNFVGMPRALDLFGENAALLPKEYSYLERAGQRAADRAQTTQAAQQAATWVGGGKYTNLKSYPAPLLAALNRRAHVTAAVRGISPQQALEEAFTGKRPLLGLAGVGLVGAPLLSGLARQDQYDY